MEVLSTALLILLGLVIFVVLCLLAFCLPSWQQYRLSKRIYNFKTGKPLSNNNYKFPFGDITATLKDAHKAETGRLKYLKEGACGWWVVNSFDVQLTNADWLRELLSIPDVKFNRDLSSFRVMGRLLGVSLLGCQGEAWNRMHKILYKAFSPANLLNFVPIFSNQARKLADQLDVSIATGKPIEMVLPLNDLTMEVILDAGFGEQITLDERRTVAHAFRHCMASSQNPLHDIPILCKLPLPQNLELERQFRNLYDTADRIVRTRRVAHATGPHNGKYVLDLLLDAKEEADEALSDVELRDNIVMLMLAGSETTATTLSWLLWHLMRLPAVREEVLREIDGLDISWDHFNVASMDDEMPVLTRVIHETLRITPAVYGIPERIFTEDGSIGDLSLPAGSRVGVAQYVMHRNPEYWPEPETFDHNRFLPENWAKQHKFSYLPFGLGRRQCMGKTFALNEIRVVMSLLLKYYTFTYDESNGPVEVYWHPPSFVIKRGLPVFVTKRV